VGRSQHERAAKVRGALGPMVLYAAPDVCVENIEPDAVLLSIKDFEQPRAQRNPLRFADLHFEDRELNSLPPVEACARDLAEPASACLVHRRHVVGYQYKHADSSRDERRICVKVTAEMAREEPSL